MRSPGIAVLVLGLLAAVAVATPRLMPEETARWHVDPLTAPPTGRPNAHRVGPNEAGDMDAAAPVWRAAPADLARAFDAVALAAPRTRRLAGDPVDLWVTYVQRSRVFGFPDYVSVCFLEAPGGGSTLAVFSRARFGHSDLGVNRVRVEKWLAALEDLAP